MENTTAKFTNIPNNEVTRDSESLARMMTWCLIGFVGHALSLFFLKCTSKSHKWRPFYRFVGALTLTDMFAFTSTHIIFAKYIFGSKETVTNKLCNYFTFSSSFGLLSSAFIICSMSFDRYKAITKPLQYHANSNGLKTTITIVSIWLISSCVCVLPLLGLGRVKQYKGGIWCFIDILSSATKDRIYNFIYSGLCSFLLIGTFTTNCAVIVSLCRSLCNDEVRSDNRRKHNISVIVLMMVFVIAFGFCLTPLTVRMLLASSFGYNGNDAVEDPSLAILAISNGILDPWIYILVRKENILACIRCFCQVGICRTRASSEEITRSRANSEEITRSRTSSEEISAVFCSTKERFQSRSSSSSTATTETHM